MTGKFERTKHQHRPTTIMGAMTTPANTQGAGSEPRCVTCGNPDTKQMRGSPDYSHRAYNGHDFVPPVTEQVDEPSGDGLCNARVCSSTGSRVCRCYLACGRRCGLLDSHPVHQIGNAHGHAFVQMGDTVTPSPRPENVVEKEENVNTSEQKCAHCGSTNLQRENPTARCNDCNGRMNMVEQVGSGEFERLLDAVMYYPTKTNWDALVSCFQRVERERDDAFTHLYASRQRMHDAEARVESLREALSHAHEWFAAFPHHRDDRVTHFTKSTAQDVENRIMAALASTSGSGNG